MLKVKIGVRSKVDYPQQAQAEENGSTINNTLHKKVYDTKPNKQFTQYTDLLFVCLCIYLIV